MKAKTRILLLLAVVAIFALVSVMLANETVEERTRNVITTGEVKISINEDTKAVNGVIRSDGSGIDFTDVLPGQTTSKIVTIRNEAEKCWLRVKVSRTFLWMRIELLRNSVRRFPSDPRQETVILDYRSKMTVSLLSLIVVRSK